MSCVGLVVLRQSIKYEKKDCFFVISFTFHYEKWQGLYYVYYWKDMIGECKTNMSCLSFEMGFVKVVLESKNDDGDEMYLR